MPTITTYTPTMALRPAQPRYRWRTTLRGILPLRLAGLVPKGAHDCGDHEWYRADKATDCCYHCVVGHRDHVPTPLVYDSAEWRMLTTGAGGSETTTRIFRERLEEHHQATRLVEHEAQRLLSR